MKTYLLDTDICIFLLKNKHGIKEKIEKAGIENCFISEITVAELTYVAYHSSDFQKHVCCFRKRIKSVFLSLEASTNRCRTASPNQQSYFGSCCASGGVKAFKINR